MPAGKRIGPSRIEGLAWVAVYLGLAAAPLGAALIGPVDDARGFLGDFSAGLGFVALAMLGLQFVLTARFRRIAPSYGLDTLLHFHRQAGLVAYVLVLAHPALFFIDDPAYAALLDPRESGLAAWGLWATVVAATLVIVLTLTRRRLGFAYAWWRLSHGLLAVVVLAGGAAHVVAVENFVDAAWEKALWIAMAAAPAALLAYGRVVKPLRMLGRPYTVADVETEGPRTWTLTLRPEGHAGTAFRAGQFAWLTIDGSPFALEQHPFSFSSSAAAPGALRFTIKALGDYTAAVGAVRPGARAYLEGPYGAFTLSPAAEEAVFIAGGVGVTPVMSILRTARDAGDRRKFTLVYASVSEDEILFRAELEALASRLALVVVHVVERPGPGWAGPAGRVTPALLAAALPPDHEGVQYFVCGPEPMMDAVDRALIAAGVPLRRRAEERFSIA